MKTKIMFISVLTLLLACATASAFSIDPFNTRPVTVGTPPSGELSLQTILNTIYGSAVVNANTDQQTAGMFQLIGTGGITPYLQFEFAGNAPSNVFGIFSGTDSTSLTTQVVFPGNATGQTNGGISNATIAWLTPNSGNITLTIGSTATVTPFSGISSSGFGFYINGPGTSSGVGGNFWSVDDLNPSNGAQMLDYVYAANDRWALAFEDLALAGADGDHNDLVVSIESMSSVSVPEPATLLLLGCGLIGLAGFARKKFRK